MANAHVHVGVEQGRGTQGVDAPMAGRGGAAPLHPAPRPHNAPGAWRAALRGAAWRGGARSIRGANPAVLYQ